MYINSNNQKIIILFLLIFGLFFSNVFGYDFNSDSSIEKFVSRGQCFSDVQYKPSNLVNISGTGISCKGTNCQGRKEMVNALSKLGGEFKKQFNTDLVVISGYRSYETQSSLFDKYKQKDGLEKALKYSSLPGSSEHQSGLAVDIFSLNNGDFEGKYKKYYDWLSSNAHKFGFTQSYKNGYDIDGYMKENWHWRYLGVGLATELKNSGKTFSQFVNYDGTGKTSCINSEIKDGIVSKKDNEKLDKKENGKIQLDESESGENEGKLPQEVLDLYKKIEEKYSKEHIYVDSNGKRFKVPNSSAYFAISGMKELKEGVQSIDNNIKLEYLMSKMLNFNVGTGDTSGGLSDHESLFTYTTYGYYLKSKQTIQKILQLGGNMQGAQRIEEYFSRNGNFIKFLLEIGLGSAIGRNESGYSFVGNSTSKQLYAAARNGGYFQIAAWCNPIGGNSIELQTGKRIYVSGENIGGQGTVYGGAYNYKSGATGYDRTCASRFGRTTQDLQMTVTKYIQLGRFYEQIDKERTSFIKSTLGSEEVALEYLGKELQYMYQYYNFVSFLVHKLGSFDSSSYIALNGSKNRNGMSQSLTNSGVSLSLEQYRNDLLKANNFNVGGGDGISFSGYQSDSNKISFRKLGITDERGYKDMILIYYYAYAGSLYNGLGNAGNSFIDNAYVSNIFWSFPQLFGKTGSVNTCRYWGEGTNWGCKEGGSLGVGLSYLFRIKYMLGQQTDSTFLNHLLSLQNNGMLKYLKITVN